MVTNSKNILVAGNAKLCFVKGHMPRADFPTAWDSVLPASRLDVGLISVDGEVLNRAVETSTIDAHQGPGQRIISTGGATTLELSGLEVNEATEYLWYGTAEVDNKLEFDNSSIVEITTFFDVADTSEGYLKFFRYVAWATAMPNGGKSFSRTAETQVPVMFTFKDKVVRLRQPAPVSA